MEHDEGLIMTSFFIHENRVHDYAMIHDGACRECNEGRGKQSAVSGRITTWHGPFSSLRDASDATKRLRRSSVGHCKLCLGKLQAAEPRSVSLPVSSAIGGLMPGIDPVKINTQTEEIDDMEKAQRLWLMIDQGSR